jgi:hypothetical protein
MTPSSMRIGARGGNVKQLFGQMVLLASAAAQSGLDITVCTRLAPAACSAPEQKTVGKMRDVVATLRVLWGEEFDANYRKYIVGTPPIVVLIPRMEMIRIANARLDGRSRNGEATQGLNINNERIVVVYDDIAPLFVAQSINHEIGHLQLREAKLSRNDEEARVRKVVETEFFVKLFGRQWLESTVAAIEKKVLPVEKNGRVYKGYTPDAVTELYKRLKEAGAKIERTRVHDRILETLVFILTNNEESLSGALAADDGQQ